MNVQEALVFGRFSLHSSPSPDTDARLLLEQILQRPHSYLIAHPNHPLSQPEEQQYQQWVRRAAQQEPIPYILGHAPFYGMVLRVNSAVLIPRPETEQLVELALQFAQSRPALNLVDVGTGSGCIAIALARHLPHAQVEAVDISADALEVARQNALQYAPGRIHFFCGSLLTPISCRPDLITANLPYVTDSEWTQLDDGIKWYEPALALKGGVDGLDLIRELLHQATTLLNPGGAIFLEIGWQQGPTALQLAKIYFPQASVQVIADYAGHDRIVTIKTG